MECFLTHFGKYHAVLFLYFKFLVVAYFRLSQVPVVVTESPTGSKQTEFVRSMRLTILVAEIYVIRCIILWLLKPRLSKD